MIAWSGSKIVSTTLRCDTSEHLRGDLDIALRAAGWALGSVISNGRKYVITSPQGLRCKCVVRDKGNSEFGVGYINIQFMSIGETVLGYDHGLAYGPSWGAHGYQVVANICQLFLSMFGITTEVVGGGFETYVKRYAVAGGIPFVSELGEATDCWWSSGIEGGYPHLRTDRTFTQAFSMCYNGVLKPDLRLYPLTPIDGVEYWIYPAQRASVYDTVNHANGRGLWLDPLMGWSGIVVGQVWDSFWLSRDTPIDAVLTSSEEVLLNGVPSTVPCSWINYGHNASGANPALGDGGTFYGSLYLLREIPVVVSGGGPGNYAY